MKIILFPEDVEKVGKEFTYRCDCGHYVRSDKDIACPDCGTEYQWPETPGSKLIAKRARAAAADLKAKERERKLSPQASYVLLVAKMGALDASAVFIRDYLNDGEQALKGSGRTVLSEMGWINSIPQATVEAKAMELHNAGESGRGLITHLVNWIIKTGGDVKPKEVAPQGNIGDEL